MKKKIGFWFGLHTEIFGVLDMGFGVHIQTQTQIILGVNVCFLIITLDFVRPAFNSDTILYI